MRWKLVGINKANKFRRLAVVAWRIEFMTRIRLVNAILVLILEHLCVTSNIIESRLQKGRLAGFTNLQDHSLARLHFYLALADCGMTRKAHQDVDLPLSLWSRVSEARHVPLTSDFGAEASRQSRPLVHPLRCKVQPFPQHEMLQHLFTIDCAWPLTEPRHPDQRPQSSCPASPHLHSTPSTSSACPQCPNDPAPSAEPN